MADPSTRHAESSEADRGNAQRRGRSATRAVLFADLGGSTRLYESLGDAEAHRIAGDCVRTIANEVERAGGTVIKTIGDEVMSTFPDAEGAQDAACAIQQAIEARDSEGPVIDVHVGFHYGALLVDDGDVFGDVVNVAARIVGLAVGGQVLTTRETVDALSPLARSKTRRIDRRTVKGKHAELEIFEVVWKEAGLTALTPVPDFEAPPAGRLVVRFAGRELEVSAERPELQIGREAACDLVVDALGVSRRHARIELRRGKFVLFDVSTNGTVVQPRSGGAVHLRREELILQGSGAIAVGEGDPSDDADAIRFEHEPPD